MTQEQTIKAAAQIDRRAVVKALMHLETIEEALKNLDKDGTKDPVWAGPWNALYSEKRKLIAAFSAYQEAAWRMVMGQQSGEREGGVFDIYDPWVGEYVPLVSKTTQETVTLDSIDGVPLKPGDVITLHDQSGRRDVAVVAPDTATIETLLKERDKKTHTDKQTHAQRQENGRRGAAKRDENKRRKLAREKNRFMLWGFTEGNQIRLIGDFLSMRSAFRRLSGERMRGYSDFIIYDNQGHRWNYDSAVHNLTKLNP